MKRFICCIAVCLVLASGCKKAESLMYSDINRIQLADTSALSATFIYEGPAVTKDTVYIEVNTIGSPADHDRPVKLVQVPEHTYTLVRDPVTNQVTDTLVEEMPFKAVPGVHFISIDDKSVQPLMVVKAGEVKARLPIVLLRDASLKDNSYRLRVELAANDAFGLGETKARARTVIFSDRLERFYSWRFDNGTAPAFYTFGKYSTGKHQFMIDVLGEVIDENWYKAAQVAGALTHYANLFKQELQRFNADPANIASGKAPVRETDSPNSAVVSFP